MNNFAISGIKPEFQKAWHYANDFMYSAIKSEEHCSQFLKQSVKWSNEEKEFLSWAWVLVKTGVDSDPVYSFNEVYSEPSFEVEQTRVKELKAKPRPRPNFKKYNQED